MEKVFLVGVKLNEDLKFESSLLELEELAGACDMEVVGTASQSMETVNKALYIGPGKAEEVKLAAEELNADLVIFDSSLSPSQLRNLQDILRLPVMDRSALILEIFAGRAKTREAKLQVEVARLQYLLPRLIGLGKALSRQGGASGSMSNKGAGEKKLELDRRRLEKRLSELRKELKEVTEERQTQRKKRSLSGIPRIALVGYTNAGKSTLMNAFLDRSESKTGNPEEKKVLEKDMLFATLDTTVRRIEMEEHQPFLLSDTVGFVDKLPHHLIDAFRSTLEEAREADLLIQVVDVSNSHHKEHIEVTGRTLKELEADGIPMILVYNKADLLEGTHSIPYVRKQGDEISVFMSAKMGVGIDELLSVMDELLSGSYETCELLIPYSDGRALSYLNENAVVRNTEYLPEGTAVSVKCRKADAAYYAKYRR